MNHLKTIQEWIHECMSFYSISLEEHTDIYYEDRSKYFSIQYKYAAAYACKNFSSTIDSKKQESIESNVLHLFTSLPEEYDEIAIQMEFSFSFCYLFANHLLGVLDKKTVWEALSYIANHWDEVGKLIVIPDTIDW